MQIKKIYFSFLLLFFFFKYDSHCQSLQDTINWRSGYQLKWEDFQAVSDDNSEHVAITNSGISYTFSYVGEKLQFEIFCYFNRKESWRKVTADSLVLLHEQGHFDITEIFARKLKQAFVNYKPVNSSIEADLKHIYDKIVQEKTLMQEQYDTETEFSTNKKQQQEWLKKNKEFL